MPMFSKDLYHGLLASRLIDYPLSEEVTNASMPLLKEEEARQTSNALFWIAAGMPALASSIVFFSSASEAGQRYIKMADGPKWLVDDFGGFIGTAAIVTNTFFALTVFSKILTSYGFGKDDNWVKTFCALPTTLQQSCIESGNFFNNTSFLGFLGLMIIELLALLSSAGTILPYWFLGLSGDPFWDTINTISALLNIIVFYPGSKVFLNWIFNNSQHTANNEELPQSLIKARAIIKANLCLQFIKYGFIAGPVVEQNTGHVIGAYRAGLVWGVEAGVFFALCNIAPSAYFTIEGIVGDGLLELLVQFYVEANSKKQGKRATDSFTLANLISFVVLLCCACSGCSADTLNRNSAVYVGAPLWAADVIGWVGNFGTAAGFNLPMCLKSLNELFPNKQDAVVAENNLLSSQNMFSDDSATATPSSRYSYSPVLVQEA